MFGPVQLYLTPEVGEAERVTEELPLQEIDPLALALALGPELLRVTSAVSVPLQPVAGLNTVKV